MKHLYPILFMFLSFQFSFSQELPRFITPYEESVLEEYIPPAGRGLVEPPSSPVRSMAEWEELEAIVIRWTNYYSDILRQIVQYSIAECEVWIVSRDSSDVREYLSSHDIVSNKIKFIDAPTNSIWIRDYGPNTIYEEATGERALVDWIYNRPRYLDDLVPEAIAEFADIPVYQTTEPPNDLVHTGGNFMSEGHHTGFSSDLVFYENGTSNNYGFSNHAPEDIKKIMKSYMGIDTYAIMPSLPYDIIHHIDMHMKVIGENTLLMGKYPEGIADGPFIENNLQYILSMFNAHRESPFKVIRIPMPPDEQGRYPHEDGHYRTYTNAVFVNKTVLVPTYEKKHDTTALRIWQEALPGHKIIGINSNKIIPAAGAIHCITKEIGVKDQLWIHHVPLMDTVPAEPEIVAEITHRDEISHAVLHYQVNEGPWQQMEMSALVDDDFSVRLPDDLTGEFRYFIKGFSTSGKAITRPMTAPEGSWSTYIESTTTVKNLTLENPQWIIYPNPASEWISAVRIDGHALKESSFTVRDLIGKKLLSSHKNEINIQGLKPGIYYLELRQHKYSSVKPFIVL